MGFDKHWKRIAELDNTKELGINDSKVRNFGTVGTLHQLMPKMRNLSLERNLIYSWEQIIHAGTELPILEQLNVSYNRLIIPEDLPS